jgi:hypothetical protein
VASEVQFALIRIVRTISIAALALLCRVAIQEQSSQGDPPDAKRTFTSPADYTEVNPAPGLIAT